MYEESKTCAGGYSLCALLAVMYVGSIYLWKPSRERNTHPSVIGRRFISVLIATVVSILCVYRFVDASLTQDHSVWAVLGFRTNGFLSATVYPLILTFVLFFGSIVIDVINKTAIIYDDKNEILSRMATFLWIRNYIVAPLTEEIVFRACMLTLIIDCTEPMKAVLLCPVFFGAAHIHHMLEQIRFGVDWKTALLISGFQFCYTTIFGAYSAYLFLRTGHIVAPVLVHSFCNSMGFPDFGSILQMQKKYQAISISALVVGLTLWTLLLDTMTNPTLFYNTLPWSSYI